MLRRVCILAALLSPTLPATAIRQLARETISGFPAQELDRYIGDKAAIHALVTMLRTSKESPYWSNAVAMLGFISPYDAGLASSLRKFIESDRPYAGCPDGTAQCGPQGKISDSLQNAKLASVFALADLARKMDPASSGFPVDYLIEGVNPNAWQKKVRWNSQPHYLTDEERNTELAERSIKALGLTCRPDARAVLLKLQKASTTKGPLADALAEALTYRCQP